MIKAILQRRLVSFFSETGNIFCCYCRLRYTSGVLHHSNSLLWPPWSVHSLAVSIESQHRPDAVPDLDGVQLQLEVHGLLQQVLIPRYVVLQLQEAKRQGAVPETAQNTRWKPSLLKTKLKNWHHSVVLDWLPWVRIPNRVQTLGAPMDVQGPGLAVE